MSTMADPYDVLGVSAAASDAEVRAAYRRLVQRHHPDHNGGSPESARRFEEVQEAYAAVRRVRKAGTGTGTRPTANGARPAAGNAAGARTGTGAGATARPVDPDLEARLAAMEQELKAARDARERAVREERRAEEALRRARTRDARAGERPTDEDLGYITTDDSFSKILDDFASDLSQRFGDARRSPAGHRVSELIDELADKLTGDRHKRP